MSGAMQLGNAIIIGWRDANNRAEVRRRSDQSVLGYVRLSEDRWFAEDCVQFPLPGTFRTRTAAVDAVLAEVNA